MPEPKLHLIESLDEAQAFMSWLGERRRWLSIDTETGGLDWWRHPLRLVQIGDTQTGWAIPWEGWGGVAKEAIEKYEGTTVMHNSKFDLHALESRGVAVRRENLHDSMAMMKLLEPNKPIGLKPASERHVMPGAAQGGIALKKVMAKNKWDWGTVPVDTPEYWIYGALDTVLSARLAETMFPLIRTKGLSEAYEIEVALAQIMCNMERRGLLVDLEYARSMADWLLPQEQAIEDQLLAFGMKTNDASVVNWFQKQGHKFTVFTSKGRIALDKYVLQGIANGGFQYSSVADLYLRHRDLHKQRVTYFEGFIEYSDDSSRIHSSIHPYKAITGRMSSERPNVQNIPAREHGKVVRDAFLAPPGHRLIAADFDQIEYRIMVSRAGEEALIKAVNAGRDLHTYMTSVVYGIPEESVQPDQRSLMKNGTFAFLYGAGNAKFASMVGVSLDEAIAFRKLYTARFPAIAAYAKQLADVGSSQGWVRTPYIGRYQMTHPDKGYKLLNYVTQGEAGDVLKKKMVDLALGGLEPYMRIPIHDEIIFEVPEAQAEEVQQEIERIMPELDHYRVPITVGSQVLTRWGDKYA